MFRLLPAFLRPLLACSGLLLALVARGQSVRWEPAAGTLARDQVSELSLVFEDCEPKENPPRPPAAPDLVFEPGIRTGEQTSINIGTGARTMRTRTLTYTFRVRPARPDGEARIPAFSVETDAGRLTVAPAGFTVAEATVRGTGQTLDQVVSARFTVPAATLWAGEVFRLTHTLDVDRRYATQSILAGPLDWSPAPIVAEEWSKASGNTTVLNGQQRFLVTQETRAIVPQPADPLALPAASQLVNLPTGQASPFSLFGQSTFEQFTIRTDPAELRVRPLPAPAPADFAGAVGQFTLASKVVPENAAVGEPVTWTLTLDGTGNWPLLDRLPARELSRDFRVVSPRAQKTAKNNSLFDATLAEDLVLIPQKAGRYTLGPYTLSVFNPQKGAYETLRTEPVVVTVAPAAVPLSAPGSPATTPSAAPGGDTTAASSSAPTPPPPGPVDALPADPLPADRLVAAPPRAAWPASLPFFALGLLAPLALWLALAARHARIHDPLRARHAAHAELVRLLARLETAPDPAALLAWQHTTRALLGLPAATPSARDLPDPIWSALWIETERALYRPATPLAPEWHAQAREALRRAAPPPRPALALLRPAHLFPRVALAAALLLSLTAAFAPVPARAADSASPLPATHSTLPATSSALDAVRAYAAGDFAKAEAALRPAVSAAPTDAGLRHNLALALAQQGRWDEAAAHAYAAALQAPGEPATARLLSVTLAKATYRPPAPSTLARRLAPRGWQTLAFVGAGLAALAPAGWVYGAYARRDPWSGLASIMLVAGLGAVAAGMLALRAHGPAADPAGVVVWKTDTLRAVPTEVGPQKVTSPLPAGTVARVDKVFLGWRRLVLRDGNTGWVRAESLVGLWQTP